MKMKIALICPSNMLYMPYVENYIQIFLNEEVDICVINWDRFKIEKKSKFTYIDSKVGHRRNFVDYVKYSRFVLRTLKTNKYDKIVVFGVQLVFFLMNFLVKEYSGKYIIDIRDYNRVVKFTNINRAINNSATTVLSSPSYKEWLPQSDKYIINHNTNIWDIDDLRKIEFSNTSNKEITVNCIGALRDYQINIDFIDSIKNSDSILLGYHGEGDINDTVLKYISDNEISNVTLTGRYLKEKEESLYYSSDIINVLRYNDCINNKTALPNRLYNSLIYGKPMVAFNGTNLSKVIETYGLGLVLENFDNSEAQIKEFLENMNIEQFDNGRRIFLECVISDNLTFRSKLNAFLMEC